MIIIEKFPRKAVDDFGDRKPTDNAVWIYPEGMPRQLRQVCSEEHLKEIIETGLKYLNDKYGETGLAIVDDLVKQHEAKDLTIKEFQKKLDEAAQNSADALNLKDEIYKLKLELEASEAEIKRLENELAATKGNQTKTADEKTNGLQKKSEKR